jgi:hypothetical protein
MMVGALMTAALTAGAQTAPAPAPAPAPAAAPTWSVGGIDFSGLVDGYYTYNANRPIDQYYGNQDYNFNDTANSFALAAAKFSMNHDPDPVGVHVDLLFGRANNDINESANDTYYLEQAFISLKPPKAKGFEADFGKFVTSAGAEVIESKDNWNYSRSLLFVDAIPYWHFGLRTSMPVTKVWTAGVQLVNGWNNDTANNGGITVGVTSAVTKPNYTWSANFYGGPQNYGTQKGKLYLYDTTLLLTPQKGKQLSKLNAYINYDYNENTTPKESHLQGIAGALHEQFAAKAALAARYEYLKSGAQSLQEFTGTYEYKWVEGLLTRVEYRRDFSNEVVFDRGNSYPGHFASGMVKAQSTLTVAFVAFFGPKR